MIFDEVREILAEQLDVDKDSIEMNSKLAEDLGADSLDAIDIVMTIEDQYAIEVPDESIENMKTVEDIVSFIESNTDANWYKQRFLDNEFCGISHNSQKSRQIFVILIRWHIIIIIVK